MVWCIMLSSCIIRSFVFSYYVLHDDARWKKYVKKRGSQKQKSPYILSECIRLFRKFQNLDIFWVFGVPRLNTDKFGMDIRNPHIDRFGQPKNWFHICEPAWESNPSRYYYTNISVTTNSESYRLIDLYNMANFGSIYS